MANTGCFSFLFVAVVLIQNHRHGRTHFTSLSFVGIINDDVFIVIVKNRQIKYPRRQPLFMNSTVPRGGSRSALESVLGCQGFFRLVCLSNVSHSLHRFENRHRIAVSA